MNNWPVVKMGEVLSLDLDRVEIDPTITYPMVGVYSFGRGLFDREPVHGGNTSYRNFYRLHSDHFVMSQLFGWEGALALSSAEFSGKFVSPQFPTFVANEEKLDRRYLGWYIRRPPFWEELGTRTRGMGDRRRTLNPEALFSCEIPLPPLSEQRQIVAKIEQLAAKIEEARGIYKDQEDRLVRLMVAMAHRADLSREQKLLSGWKEIHLGDVISLKLDSVQVDPSKIYPNLGILSFGRGLFHKPAIEGTLTSANTLYRVNPGQFIYSRLFAFEGAYGMITDEFAGHFVSGEFPTFSCDSGRILADFLWAYFRSPRVWIELASESKGLGHRRQRVHPEKILAYTCMIPPIEWQHKIAKVQASMDRLKAQQAQTAAELQALLPPILDKAFKGEL